MTTSSTTRVRINDKTADFPAGATVLDAVAETTGRELTHTGTPVDGSRLGVAVAVGGEVLPRAQWATVELSDDAQLEIVTAVQGG